MPVLNVNGHMVHFQELNAPGKDTILMIHGMLGNLSVYYYKIAPLLARNFRVIMYDLKSHGMSERVPAGYDLGSMAEDTLGIINALQLKKVHLVGYSFGALIALRTAIAFPEKIRKLAIIEGPDPYDPEPFERIDEYSRRSLETYAAGVTDIFGRKIGERNIERTHRLYEYLFRETTIRYDMRQERDFFTRGGIDRIPHETLLVYGRRSDCLVDGEILARTIRRATLSLYDTDHQLPLRHPTELALELQSFFIG